MDNKPQRVEIDHHTIRLIIGVIAISLATVTSYLAGKPLINSISASYHTGGPARDVFVGFLFAIAAFMLAYNGRSTWQMIFSKVAALAAVGVAFFPCECGGETGLRCSTKFTDALNEIATAACEGCIASQKISVAYVHGASAAVMFSILAFFCYSFYKRAKGKGRSRANLRATIYAICGLVIVACIAVIAYDGFTDGSIREHIKRLVFWGEATGLYAFGIAWLVASRKVPGITDPDERLPLSPYAEPDRDD